MFFETILFGAFITLSSAAFLLIGCSKNKSMAPSVAPRATSPAAASPANCTKSPVSKSPAKEVEPEKEEEKKEEAKKEEEKKEEKKEEEEEEKKKEKKKKASDEKDDEDDDKKNKKKASDENGEEKEDEKKDESKENAAGKKMLVSVDPLELKFEVAKTTQKKLKLTNVTDKTIMFKIKSSTTSAYLINPVFGKINPKGSFEVTITHKPSEKREDKLVVVTSEMIGKEIDMHKTFKTIKTTGPDVIVKLIAA